MGFGDSLTAGTPGYEPSLDWGDIEYQYGFWLSHEATEAGFQRPVFNNQGVPGELAQTMLPRLRALLAKDQYDVVIILAGSNDIGWGREVNDIFNDLKSLWRETSDYKSTVVACTIPPIRARFPPIQGSQRELNRLILSHHHNLSSFYTVDIFHDLCDEDRLLVVDYDSGDGLHLNKAGYRRMGEAIWDGAIKDIIQSHERV